MSSLDFVASRHLVGRRSVTYASSVTGPIIHWWRGLISIRSISRIAPCVYIVVFMDADSMLAHLCL